MSIMICVVLDSCAGLAEVEQRAKEHEGQNMPLPMVILMFHSQEHRRTEIRE